MPAPGCATAAARIPSPMIELVDSRLAATGVRLLLKRDDLIHPRVPGNKWRKLSHNLAEAAARHHHTLLTFGGAYSNHLRATAAAGELFGFATIGVVRGEQHLPLNPSLTAAVASGMRLTYLDRASYRRKDDPDLRAALRDRWGRFYLLPEGGSNALAVRGCAETTAEIERPFDVICCPVGTGGTLAGLAAGLRPGQRAIGFSVLKAAVDLDGRVEHLQRSLYGHRRGEWHIEHGFHAGGYARTTPELDEFTVDFADRHGVALDRVYPAKMMFGIFALVTSRAIAAGSTVVAVITG